MNRYLKALTHPVTIMNLVFVGSLFVVGTLHNMYHHDMNKDADAFVFQWCRENPEKCDSF